MVVCHCFALNDQAIAAAARAGANSVDAIAAGCGAGSDCGGCRPIIEDVLVTARVKDRGEVRSIE